MSKQTTLQDRIESFLRNIVTEHLPDFMDGDEEYAPGGADAIDHLREIVNVADGLLRDIDEAHRRDIHQPASNAIVRDIPQMFSGLEGLEEVEPGYLLGEVRISGTRHHVEFVRVEESVAGQVVWNSGEQAVTDNNWYRLQLMRGYDGGVHQSVEVAGFEGRYVCFCTPYLKRCKP